MNKFIGQDLSIVSSSPGTTTDPVKKSMELLPFGPVVLVDTAGRMQNKTNLMNELNKVKRVANPHLTLFVGDSLAGNDAVDQARMFQEIMQFDGAVLTKLDTDAKGGAGLSIAFATGRPIVFAGVGQGYDDLMQFDPDWLLDQLFE